MVKLAEIVKPVKPVLADFLIHGRYVDDLANSKTSTDEVTSMIGDADELFKSVGLSCKGWSFSGADPHPDTTSDGQTVDVAGMAWSSKVDTVEIKIPPLHFGKKSRGRLVVGTEVFERDFVDLQKFVPEKITRRNVFSKYGALWDISGKFTPITVTMKLLLRRTVAETEDWIDKT